MPNGPRSPPGLRRLTGGSAGHHGVLRSDVLVGHNGACPALRLPPSLPVRLPNAMASAALPRKRVVPPPLRPPLHRRRGHKLACPPRNRGWHQRRGMSRHSPASSNDETSTSSTNSTAPATGRFGHRDVPLTARPTKLIRATLISLMITRVDGARTVDDRKPHPAWPTRARMDQPDHAERDGDRNTCPYQARRPGASSTSSAR